MFLLVPATAGADVFLHGVETEGYWTNNLYGASEGDEVDAGSVRAKPWGQVSETEGDLGYSLRYAPSYEYFPTENHVSGFDHDATGTMTWRMTPRTRLDLSETFRRTHTIERFNEGTEPGQDLLLQSRRSRVKANFATGGLSHLLTPTDQLTFSGSWGFQDLSQDDATDSEFLGSSIEYSHQVSERLSIGTSFSFNRQTTKPNSDLDKDTATPQQLTLAEDRDTDFYDLAATFTYTFSPTLELAFSAGPALVVSDQTDPISQDTIPVAAFPLFRDDEGRFLIDAGTCPSVKLNGTKQHFLGASCQRFAGYAPLNDGQQFVLSQGNFNAPIEGSFDSLDDTTPTYFADITLSKEWERWNGALTYRRSEDRSSNLGAISDAVFGRLRWQLTQKLASTWLAGYERREQATEIQTNVQIVANEPAPLPALGNPLGAASQSVQRVTLDNDLSVDVITAAWQLSYRLGERTELYASAAYREETPSSSASAVLLDTNRFNFTVAVRYTFAPIPF